MAGGPVALGIMVASQLAQGVGEFQQQNAAAGADRENARLAELGGAYREEAIRRQGRAVSGEAISAQAANGVALGEGSAGDLLFQNMLETQHAALTARYDAAGEAWAYRRSAASHKAAAKGALFGGMMRAGAQALTGMDQMGGAAAAAQAAATVREARWPGAMKLPIPDHLQPSYAPSSGPFNNGYFGNY